MTEEDQEYVRSYFREYMLPYVQPVLLIEGMVRPFLNNAQLYLAILMHEKEGKNRGGLRHREDPERPPAALHRAAEYRRGA